MKFDNYTIIAQLFPALLTSLPLVILTFYIIENPEAKGLMDYILNIKFLGEITISLAILFLYAQLIRITSKFFQRRYFVNARGLPTTYLLTYEDSTFTDSYKDEFRIKAKQKLNKLLFDRDEEISNPIVARKLIDESIKQIIPIVGDRKLVKWHNVWYGFFRNLLGGVVFGITFTLLNIVLGLTVFDEHFLVYVSVVLCLLYIGIFLCRKLLLFQVAEDYAKKLIAEFMAMQ